MLKFDLAKIREKMDENKEKMENLKNKKFVKKEKDIKTDILAKVDKEGDHKFRAYPYVHNKDYLSEPFPERYYHFGIPGNRIVYCPQKNDNAKCHICDFVWSQMKEFKGTETVKEWKNFLPKKRIFIPGEFRGRQDEGTKFFCLSTFEDRMGDHHLKLYKALNDEDLFDFLDPANGYDLILSYEKYSDEQSKRFFGAKFGFKDLEIGRTRNALCENVEERWAEIEKTMPNVDVDIPKYEKKTEEDTLKIVADWAENAAKEKKYNDRGKKVDESNDSDGEIVESPAEKTTQVKAEDLPVARTVEAPKEKPNTDDRKARARAMMLKAKG